MSRQPDRRPIRVLVVEDSRAQRELLVGLLRAASSFEVAGTASNGREAIDATLRLHPDVIAMDIHLPIMDGYDAAREIMQRCPTPIVMVSSGESSRRSIQAIAAGALAVVRKPAGSAMAGAAEDRETFLTTLRLMAGVRVVTRFPSRQAPTAREAGTPIRPTPVSWQPDKRTRPPFAAPQVLAIAASTGGPIAIQTLLRGLGKQVSLPILVVQHIARGFVEAFAEWLNATVPQPVALARHTEPLLRGHVYLAPDDYHLIAQSRAVAALRSGTQDDRYCPSANVLFESVARAYGARAIGVVLTGMGDDGTQGLRALWEMGGQTLAQDEASCVVYGMPGAAVAAGVITAVAPLRALADMILQRVAEADSQEPA
jgi:two-component system, chemotaxis family, protein-glutamate methylesterase/glutaminase